MARNNAKKRGSGRKTVAIVVDGETEMWYLQMLQRIERIPGVTLKPDLPQAKKLKNQFEEVMENARDFDISVWVLDLDVVIKENAVEQLEGYRKLIQQKKNAHILINTPCLEFWFYQHFVDSGKYFADCYSLLREFKTIPVLKEYEKTKKFFVENNPNIYERLKPYLNTGLLNSEKRGIFDLANPQTGIAEIHLIFKILNHIIS